MINPRSITLIVFPVAALVSGSIVWGQGGFGEADADGDGKVSFSELEEYVSGKLDGFDRFKELMKALDKDDNGSISEEEFADRMTAVRAVMGRERSTENDKKGEGKKSRRRPSDKAPKVGDVAPTFKLKSLDGKSETDLAEFKGKKPVVLIFGSYT